MKVLISNRQFNLLKESFAQKQLDAIEKYWRNELKKGNQIRFEEDELSDWGIEKRSDKIQAQIKFQELVGDEDFAKKVINGLMNKKFSTKDFSDRIVGGFDFEWVITDMEYRDYDFFLYGKTLPGGSVSIMDGRHFSLKDALENEDIGYEIQDEVNGVVQDCMIKIILPITGYSVIVPMVYIDEE